MERGPTIFLSLTLVGLIAVLCSEHRRSAGLIVPGQPAVDMDDYVGVSNAPVQKPGPAYLLFNLPWCVPKSIPAMPFVDDGKSEC